MKKTTFILFTFLLAYAANTNAQGVVDIVFNGSKATYSIPDSVKGVTVGVNGAKVTVLSTTTTKEYTYRLSGSSDNGSFTLNGQYKLKLQLDGLTLTNAKSGAAIDIECGKRIDVVLTDGTVNTLCDSKNGDQKAAFYIKGHAEFKGGGTLNVTGNLKHAIAVKEYIEMKSTLGNINILGAVGDGINCGNGEKGDGNNYFLMRGGKVTIANVGSDGIDTDDYGVVRIENGTLDIAIGDDATGMKADSTVNISGGTININVDGQDSKAIRANLAVNIFGGKTKLVVVGDGSKGIKANKETAKGSTVANGGYVNVCGGETVIDVTGGNLVTTTAGVADTTKCMGMSVDADFIMTNGTLSITARGDEARTYNVKGTETLMGGTLKTVNITKEEKIYGDVNEDGFVDVADISRVITVMADGEYSENADVNEDGTVDVADISRVITVMTGFE